MVAQTNMQEARKRLERKKYAALVLAEFDKQTRQQEAPVRAARAEVRRKAKEKL